jgi:hypothetical protein
MSVEQLNTTEVKEKYPNLDFEVYDASDFAPRGSLRGADVVTPPYPISERSKDIDSIDAIIGVVKKLDADSDIEMEIKGMTVLYDEVDEDSRLQRRPPEEISPVLNLNFLRFRFGEWRNREKDVFKAGDKIAILKSKDKYSGILVVDLTRGKTMRLNPNEHEDNEMLKRFIVKDDNKAKRSGPGKRKAESPEPLFEEQDLEVRKKEARDRGQKINYPPETRTLHTKMHEADIEVEHLLINEIRTVALVSDSIHRLAKRAGREKTGKLLAKMRNEGFAGSDELLEDLARDIEFSSAIGFESGRGKTLSADVVKRGLELMFRCERLYLDAVIEFPWNKVGPEPFDTLINVFWYRFDFDRLKNDWERRPRWYKYNRKEAYKQAQIERILTWAHKTQNGLIVSHLKDLKELDITYTMDEVEQVAGSLSRFFNEKGSIDKILKDSRPSQLTKLLWSSLKWASASEWKAARTMMTSDFRYIDPEIWEEKFADPEWAEIGDLHGRLILPGETLKRPMSHLKAGSTRLKQAEKEAVFEEEQGGGKLSFADVVLERQKILKDPVVLKSFESSVYDFNKAVSSLSYDELMRKVMSLSGIQRAIVLHRLGYAQSGQTSGIITRFGGVSIEDWRPVMYVINACFDGNSRKYYKTVRETAQKLLA